MDNQGTGFFDKLEDDLSESDNKVVEKDSKASGEPADYIKPEVYHNRGFIKDGELVDNAEKVIGVHGSPLSTYIDDVSMRICSEDCLVAIVTKEPADIEKTLLSVLASSKHFDQESRTSIGEQLPIYVFRPFDNKKACGVNLPNNLKVFMGEYTFIKTLRGWTLLNFNRAIAVPVKEGE